MNRAALALAVLVLNSGFSLALAQELTKCVAGQEVIDSEGKSGIIIAGSDKLCQVKYPDGQIYSWIFWNLHPATAAAKPRLAAPDATAPGPTDKPASSNSIPAPTVLRPSASRTLVYRADRLGQFRLTAAVNGTPIRFVVDTGASFVDLTVDDALAAGISRSELVFNHIAHTANGPVRVALIMLREIRIEQLSVENVAAFVQEQNLTQSLLGMSFLRRVRFEMREGALTINQ